MYVKVKNNSTSMKINYTDNISQTFNFILPGETLSIPYWSYRQILMGGDLEAKQAISLIASSAKTPVALIVTGKQIGRAHV